MQRDHRRSRLSPARWGWTFALAALCLTLAACDGVAARQTPTPTTPPTATINTKGAGQTFGPTPLPTTPPPYAFPATWTNAPGLPPTGGVSPTALAFAPSDGRIGYLCNGSNGRLYATHDGGANWSQLHLSATTGCGAVFSDAHNASDLFVTTASVAQTGGVPNSEDLWRSRDGGASWSKLAGVQKPTDPRLGWSQLAVVGSRLIGAVQVDQEGYLQNGLFASSDGGATWKPFAQSVANQGYTIGGFTLLGSAIYINSTKGTNPGGMEPQLWARGDAQSGVRALAAPLSGQPNGQVFWRSLDGGATWSQVTLPGANQNSAGGSFLYAAGNYALCMDETNISTDNQNPLYDAQMWWSADSGATWKRLPDMRGLENGYVIAGGDSNGELALAPDGSVIAAAQHAAQSYGDDAGIFRIQPDAASPAWTPLVAGGVQDLQVEQTSVGLRLWGIGSYESDTHLKYVDVAG